jgi:cellulose synthase (UDP-forming)
VHQAALATRHCRDTAGPVRHVRREQALTVLGLGLSLGLSGWLGWSLVQVTAAQWRLGWDHGLKAVAFTASAIAVIYGSAVFLTARLGWLRRVASHRPASRSEVDADVFGGATEPLVILVPAYREDAEVVRQTLLSAALQDYPERRVVLLLDDPPDAADALTLAVRELPRTIGAMLHPMADRLRRERKAFEARRSHDGLDEAGERRHLAALYDEAADWFAEHERCERVDNHTSRHFVLTTFGAHASDLRAAAAWLRRPGQARLTTDRCAVAYRRLAAVFDVTIEVFERKRFVNLSHEPNKAMNLNAYVGLMGGEFTVLEHADQRILVTAHGDPDLVMPDATWVLTLDADSLLVHDYASRLVQQMAAPGMERVAVIQTPYSAVPGAPGLLERIAGATTDIMHHVHQGMSAYDATYWVGANALLRKTALEDIVTYTLERGHWVPRYIQDRTVIEDTESSIDLVARGWSLYNYPERLAFSATPPDYGALLVQRRRWANGGLIIMPKLMRHVLSNRHPRHWLPAMMRLHYLVSIACVNTALIVLTTVPFAQALASPLLPLICVPYFALYARDLQLTGYRARDLCHVYALNVLLTPVNMGGVLKSIQQGLTGRRIPFGRTPKVAARTPAPPLYLVATLAMIALWSAGAAYDYAAARWSHAALAGSNAAVLAYALGRFIGWRSCIADLRVAAHQRRCALRDTLHGCLPPRRRQPAHARARANAADKMVLSSQRGSR